MEPFGYDVIRAVEGAEADRADELAARQRLQVAGDERPGQDGHAAVERDVVGKAEPCAAPGVHAERGDVQEASVSKTSQSGSTRRRGVCHGGLAGPAEVPRRHRSSPRTCWRRWR